MKRVSALRPLLAVLGMCGIAAVAHASSLAEHFERIELQRVDDRPGIAALVLDEEANAAWVDFGLGSAYIDQEWYAVPTEDIEILFERKRKDLDYAVEQRLVTYLNLSGEGPHVSLDVEATTDWAELTQLAPGRYQMRSTEPATLDVTPEQIIEIVRRQEPDWVDYAKQCTSVNGGPCYTVTDQEFRISVRRGQEKELIGTFRIYQPNGC